jgi:hypothetical protein
VGVVFLISYFFIDKKMKNESNKVTTQVKKTTFVGSVLKVNIISHRQKNTHLNNEKMPLNIAHPPVFPFPL